MTGNAEDMRPPGKAEREFVTVFRLLGDEKRRLLADAAVELAAFENSDTLCAFRRWSRDARLESLMAIAARLDDDDLDQLLLDAEDFALPERAPRGSSD